MTNLQIIYNFSVSNTWEEQMILSRYEDAGKPLEQLPCFEVKEIKRQSRKEALSDVLKP